MSNPATVFLVSDFTLDLLGGFLQRSEHAPSCVVSSSGFGQAYQAMLGAGSSPEEIDFGIVWTRAEGVLPTYAMALEGHEVDAKTILAEVDEYIDAVRNFAAKARFVLCATWVVPAGHRGHGSLDWRPGSGLSFLTAQMNLRLSEGLQNCANVFVLDTARWLQSVGPGAPAPRMWFAGKVPYANAVFKAAAVDLKAAMRATLGLARKLIVLDLDNTLWGGVVGETGWQGVRLGGHDFVGEAFAEFQRSLKSLTRQGVQLAIASKNDEAVALDVFKNHPEMVLQLNDIAAWRIDWNDKAQNILDIAAELNLGLDSIVFIDDNPAERARVQDALPDVIVPDWSADPVSFSAMLNALPWFDLAALSKEDRKRGEMYAQERARRAELSLTNSLDDWLKSLGQQVKIAPLSSADLARATQLMNKTNQLNLSTRRLAETELEAWAAKAGTQLWTVRVEDKFGDAGLTGIISVEVSQDEATIADFVMSCRVMGRRVEDAMIYLAARYARQQGAKRLVARYLPTERNKPALMVFRQSGLEDIGDGEFVWDCGADYPAPTGIELIGADLTQDD